MGLGSEFADILDSLRGYVSDSLDSLRALFRGGGAEEGAPAARAAEEIIGEGGSEARPLSYWDFLRRIRGKRALAEELAAFRGSSIEDELRALREGEFQDIERALRERVRGLKGWQKALLAGLGLGGGALGGLALLSYLNNRNQGYSYPPPSTPSSSSSIEEPLKAASSSARALFPLILLKKSQ